MAERPLRILQVSPTDICGGAEKVAWDLFQSYRERGYESRLAVGCKQSTDPDVLVLSNGEKSNYWKNFCAAMSTRLKPLEHGLPGIWRVRAWFDEWERPVRRMRRRLGLDNFYYPGSRRILTLQPQKPDIVHCHNLHGEYFDLRVLPWLSRQSRILLTLHDAWLLSGLCSHAFECERWTTGCGRCPQLILYPTLYPGTGRDATAWNWRRKQKIYRRSRLYIATPSRWLMQKVEQSILAAAVIEARVIPNGVDLSVFHPTTDKDAVRAKLGIRPGTKVLLFVANGVWTNLSKDYQTLRQAVERIAEREGRRDVLFIVLGESAPGERIDPAEVRFVPFQNDPLAVARYYQAADVYIHAARADTFPNTVLEALACGIPVVATAVGGIPEQIKGLAITDDGSRNSDLNRYELDEATGILVGQGDAEGMAIGIARLLGDDALRRRIGENAARDSAERFDLSRQVDAYLRWYEEILRRPELPMASPKPASELNSFAQMNSGQLQ